MGKKMVRCFSCEKKVVPSLCLIGDGNEFVEKCPDCGRLLSPGTPFGDPIVEVKRKTE